ncbi:MAG: hypothetical protein CM1200mP9_09900 [Gammaproteobacteria bacterium]|nr:MAG: hypothetical protein CM1200mP9_09900 [Gammaproteobacteria bacterium]
MPFIEILVTRPEKISRSALTMLHCMVLAIIYAANALGFLPGVLDGSHHIERLLRQIVGLAIQNGFEAADRVLS